MATAAAAAVVTTASMTTVDYCRKPRAPSITPVERLRLDLVTLLASLDEKNCPVSTRQQLLCEMPRRWELHTDLVLLPRDAWSSAHDWPEHVAVQVWPVIAQSLRVQRIAQRAGGSRPDDFRSPTVQLLWPPAADEWVQRRENGVLYSWPITRCMFSAGNVSEKLRVAAWHCTDEVVVDLYAGIGYWTLPLLMHAGAARVFACEWNPASVEALTRNLTLNRVAAERCAVLLGDNRVHAPRAVAQRVLLGLLPSSEAGWPVACAALDPVRGGWLHVHAAVDEQLPLSDDTGPVLLDEATATFSCNRRDGARPSWQVWARHCTTQLAQLLDGAVHGGGCWTVRAAHLERVKAFAPRVHHLVLDVECRPPAAARDS